MRIHRRAGLLIAATILAGCKPEVVDPPPIQNGEFVIQLGGACFGRVLEPITVFIDSNYIGQVSPGGRLTATITPGRHQLNASGGPWRWGPFEIESTQGGATLNC